jgi:hypothetical protein
MSPLQQRIAAVTDTTANLIAQLRELELLRERVREAQLSAKREPRLKRLNGNGTIPRVSLESSEREPARSRGGPPEPTAVAPRRTALG